MGSGCQQLDFPFFERFIQLVATPLPQKSGGEVIFASQHLDTGLLVVLAHSQIFKFRFRVYRNYIRTSQGVFFIPKSLPARAIGVGCNVYPAFTRAPVSWANRLPPDNSCGNHVSWQIFALYVSSPHCRN